jgi:branched-chain amino acid transport system ATP-binding protein
VLEITDLVVSYGHVQAVRGVSINVHPGALVALIGGNGAGKSSVLNAAAGLVKPRAGRIMFAGRDVSSWPAHRVARSGLVLVPQGRQVIAPLSVRENLELGAYVRRDAEISADMEQMFVRFPQLATRRSQLAGLLSGGEQQMLAMARGLMSRPKMMLMDEPSMGLSPKILDQLFGAIRNIASSGVPVLLVEQNAIKALEISDYAYVLQNGEVVHSGPSAELRDDPRIVSAYLGY